jgi:hypothetical protein
MATIIGFENRRSARIQQHMTADLGEALDMVALLAEALVQALDGRSPTGLEAAALSATEALCHKHHRPAQAAFAPVVSKSGSAKSGLARSGDPKSGNGAAAPPANRTVEPSSP